MEMKLKHNTIRMLVKGGAITPSHLLQILDVARKAGNKGISFGSRQDIIFQFSNSNSDSFFKELSELKMDYILNTGNASRRQNIVSSFAASDIFLNTQWLTSNRYLDILKTFTFPHLLRINISDPRQSLVPLYYGNLNFVASHRDDCWFLFLRLPSDYERVMWPALIKSADLYKVAKAIESTWLNKNNININSLFESVNSNIDHEIIDIDSPLVEPQYQAEDYEGFGRMHSSDNYWAGFYWRNNRYDIGFMEEMCRLCIKTGVDRLALTPWKSFIVKDIEEKNLIHWKALDGRYGITMRHSAFELNWHLPLGNNDALRLKRFIVRKFDKKDVCVHGLTFGISTDYELPFCTVMIKENPIAPFLRSFDFLKTYDVEVADHYNPNKCKYYSFVNGCRHHQLPNVLAKVTLLFFEKFIPGLYSENIYSEGE
ncbi:MAG: hypothetical protein JXB17_05310 [Bacteroidales bacterium]|nr:hypothetical protein [Bacteroidales bacterium]